MLKPLDSLTFISMTAGIKFLVQPSSVLIVPTKPKSQIGVTLALDKTVGKAFTSLP